MEQSPTAADRSGRTAKFKHRIIDWRWLVIGLVIIAIALAGATLDVTTRQPRQQDDRLPPAVLARADFQVYSYTGQLPGNFKLDSQSATISQGIIVMTLSRPSDNKKIIITQQASGSFDHTSLQADKVFRTDSGQAYITDAQTRTTAALFTDDKTWILLNSPDPIGGELAEQLLRRLKPVEP